MKVVKEKSQITRSRSIEINLRKRFWVAFGFSPRQVALGFTVNRYQIHLDLLFVWMSIEL